jgi:hypothetical protein
MLDSHYSPCNLASLLLYKKNKQILFDRGKLFLNDKRVQHNLSKKKRIKRNENGLPIMLGTIKIKKMKRIIK